MVTPLRVDGVDISHYQSGVIDYAAAKRAGVKFMYHKATEGTSYVDGYYARRRSEALKAGLPFGAYHFARPSVGDAVEEATNFLRVASPHPGDMIPMLDLEANDDKLTQAQLTAWVKSFVAVVKAKIGVKPIIYTPFDLDNNFGAHLWVARYSDVNAEPRIPAPWDKYTVRQLSNGINGVPNSIAGFGNVDLNTLGAGVSVEDLMIPKEKPPVPTGRKQFTQATHNVWYVLDASKREKDLAASAAADIVNYQEVSERPIKQQVKDFCSAMDRGLYMPRLGGNPISWKKKTFTQLKSGLVPIEGTVRTHRGASFFGIKVGKAPSRRFSYVGLQHNETGQRVLVINVHPTAHATSKEPATGGEPAQVSTYRDWSVAQYWLRVISFVAGELAKQASEKSLDRFWDAVILAGAYNASLGNLREWYYPGSLLSVLFEPDAQPNGLDHIQIARGSDLLPLRRRSVDGFTDHRIHFVDMIIKERIDYPRDV